MEVLEGWGSVGLAGRLCCADAVEVCGRTEPTHRSPISCFVSLILKSKPGRRYEYRVRLVMGDPNHSVYPRYLTKSAADRRSSWRKPYRFTDWSQPSPPIAVPFAGRMLAGRAKAPSPQLFDVEPKISVLVKTFDTPEAAEAMTELADAVRGTVGNLTRSIDIPKLVGDRLQPMENYRFHTESTILDIRGGRKLSRSSNEDPHRAGAHIDPHPQREAYRSIGTKKSARIRRVSGHV